MSEYTLNGCRYVVRRETVKDALKADSIARLFPTNYPWEVARTFVRYGILTTVDGEPVLGKPIEELSGAELYAACEVWSDNDPDAAYLFYDAVQRNKAAINPPHLKPGVEPGNSEAPNETNG